MGEYCWNALKLERSANSRLADIGRNWYRMCSRAKPMVQVALVGKYVELHDAYFSVREALEHAGLALGLDVNINWVHSSDLGKGTWLGYRCSSRMVSSCQVDLAAAASKGKSRQSTMPVKNLVPYLGLCLGMQLMVVEFARHLLGSDEPNSTEFDRSTSYPVIDLMPDQRSIADMGGTMRLGLYPCQLEPGTKARLSLSKTSGAGTSPAPF